MTTSQVIYKMVRILKVILPPIFPGVGDGDVFAMKIMNR